MFTKLINSPFRLFLLDAAGAFVSALMIGVVLVRYQAYVGVPAGNLYLLAACPVGFLVFDLLCLATGWWGEGWSLRTVAGLNLAYVLLSLVLMAVHQATLTTIGWGYFCAELIIIVALANAEIRAARLADLRPKTEE